VGGERPRARPHPRHPPRSALIRAGSGGPQTRRRNAPGSVQGRGARTRLETVGDRSAARCADGRGTDQRRMRHHRVLESQRAARRIGERGRQSSVRRLPEITYAMMQTATIGAAGIARGSLFPAYVEPHQENERGRREHRGALRPHRKSPHRPFTFREGGREPPRAALSSRAIGQRSARFRALRCEFQQRANGRYWARTSDPQLVELVLSQLS
jgi:hypothetical protein